MLCKRGQAWLLHVQAKDMAEQAVYQALFDRSDDYTLWLSDLAESRKALPGFGSAELNRLQRRQARVYDAIRKIDFFPGEASIRAEAQWRDFSNAIDAMQSPGEPQATAGCIARRDRMQYQGRLWATRRNLWVDRVASAWLIQRFIDPHARFQWLETPADCPPDALGFDFDGATFSHVGDQVTFEVLLASFGLDGDRGLSQLGAMVHALDVGGTSTAEAAGFEAVLAGARKRWSDDDSLLADIGGVLDSLHAHFPADASHSHSRTSKSNMNDLNTTVLADTSAASPRLHTLAACALHAGSGRLGLWRSRGWRAICTAIWWKSASGLPMPTIRKAWLLPS